MNGREALKELADGKRVRRSCWDKDRFMSLERGAEPWTFYSEDVDSTHDWEIVEKPATYEELVEEMRAIAQAASYAYERTAYEHCADMLEKRSVAL